MRSSELHLGGWGNYPTYTSDVYRPERWQDVIAVVNEADASGLIARGLGRSYGDAALNQDGGILLGTRLNRLLDFDSHAGIVECEAGVVLGDLITLFLPRGWFLPVTPGTQYVTLGGAIAADVHGKNHHCDGSLASFVVDFQLVTGRGEILTCSREENRDAFWATVGGMGLTGVILTARLRLRRVPTSYIMVDYLRAQDLDEVLGHMDTSDARYQYSVAWIDTVARGGALGRSVLIRGNHADVDQLSPAQARNPLTIAAKFKVSLPFHVPAFVINPRTVGVFNNAYYAKHPARQGVTCDYESFFYPLDSVLNWNRVYGKRGFIQYQVVMEPDSQHRGLIALLEELSKQPQASFLSVLKAFGAGSDGLLSFPKPGYTLALDIPNSGPESIDLVRSLNRIALRHGGRVYLAKDAYLDPHTFSEMYPQSERFKEIKQTLDPDQHFSSSLARRVGLVENS